MKPALIGLIGAAAVVCASTAMAQTAGDILGRYAPRRRRSDDIDPGFHS
jgi:hypothetical protein